MKFRILILIFLVTSVFNFNIFADSPLTSTPFADAYAIEPIITKASQANGQLNAELMDYLSNKKNPIALKMAIINKIGWDIEGKKMLWFLLII